MKVSTVRLVFIFATPWMSSCQEIQDQSKDESNSESRLSTWYKRVKDPSFECPPIFTDDQDQAFTPPKSPEIFLVTDCDEPGARWDYNYKVSAIRN